MISRQRKRGGYRLLELLPLSAILWAIGGLWFPALLVLCLLSGLLEDSFHAEATLSAPAGET